jgi:hypothetical protein
MTTPHVMRKVLLAVALLAAYPAPRAYADDVTSGGQPPAAPATPAPHPCGSPKGSFNFWLNFRLCELAAAAIPQDDQAEAPSATPGSTSLVEKGTAPDLFSLALGLVTAGANDDEDETATAMTVSAYAFRTSATGENPLDPAVYTKHRNWRRVAFTAGRAQAEGNAPDGRVFGVKVLAIDKRDISDGANAKHFRTLNGILLKEAAAVNLAMTRAVRFIAEALPDLAGDMSPIAFAAKHLEAANFEATLARLTPSQRTALDALLVEPAKALAAHHKEIDPLVQAVRRAPQLALSYHAIVRPQDGNDEHHFAVAFDVALGTRLVATANGGVVRIDSKHVSDTTAAKIAGELQFDLQRLANFDDVVRLNGRDPMTVSVAGLGEWHSDDGPKIGKVQVKLTVPLPGFLAGLKVPISVTYANRTELIDEDEVRGSVGFTVDLSKLQSALRAFRR